MRKKIIALALVALALVGMLPAGAAAGTGRVVFESGAPDADGVFTVTMKVSDMTVWGIQFALKYDTSVIQPVDAKGDPAEKLTDFADVVQPWTEMVNRDFFPEQGLLGSTCITSLNATGDQIDEVGNAVLGSELLDIFTFRFKRLKDGDAGLELATEAKGEPFQVEVPNGVLAIDLWLNELAVDVSFREVDDLTGGRSETVTPTEPPEPEKDPEELLKDVIVLQIGSHAAVARGNVTAIYHGERDVTAYAHDNRTFVPVRFISERLGATVGWDNDAQAVSVEKDGHKITMAVGSSTYYLDGEAKTLDAPAEFTPSTNGNSRTMVPIRFVSEALGYQVEWDQVRNLVVIAPKALNWDPKGTAEGLALDSAVAKLVMYSNFV